MSEYDFERVQVPHRKKRYISARFFWLTSVLAGIIFFAAFCRLAMFPVKWRIYLLLVLVILLLLTFLLSIKTKAKNVFTRFVNGSVTVCLFACSVFLPYEADKVSSLFSGIGGQYVKINLYALADSEYASMNLQSDNDLSKIKDAVFITDSQGNDDNETYVLDQLKKYNSSLDTDTCTNVLNAVKALYEKTGDILVMSSGFESMIQDTEEYGSFSNDTKVIYSFYRSVDGNENTVTAADITTKPFTVYIGGNDDTGELTLEGRTDVNILVTVNPVSHQIVTVGLPRDSYIPNPALNNEYDKLTHLGLQGMENTMEGLGNYLDVNADYYVLVNFTTFTEIIDAIGGVDIDNPYSFNWDYDDHHYFPEGNIHLDGDTALKYVRERHNLPDGDFGRNMHQQIVLKAMIKKVTSTEGVIHLNDLLDSLNGKFLTNLSSESIFALIQKQLSESIQWNTVSYHVEGDVDMAECASAPGQDLSIVRPYENQIEYVRHVIDQVEAGETITEEELPEGTNS